MTAEKIAPIIHETIRQIQIAFNESVSKPWGESTEDMIMTIDGIQYLFDYPYITTEDIHKNWSLNKESHGWKYGPVKDVSKKEHPLLVPYEQLSEYNKAKDKVFITLTEILRNV